jgi:hypothetical protein
MSLFKQANKKPTRLHPQLKRLTQHIMTLRDDQNKPIKLYEFKTLYDMPAARYSKFNEYMEDRQRGISRTELEENLKACIDEINEGKPTNNANAITILRWMLSRMKVAYDADIVMRLISVAVFTKEEDLTGYDWDYNTWKIELFEKQGVSAFFLSEPIKKYWTAMDISTSDMELIAEQNKIKKQVLKELQEMGISLSAGLEEKKETGN